MSLKELIPLLALVVTNLVAVAGIVYYMASALGKRIGDLDKRIDGLDKRIDGLDKRIDDLGSNMNERFSDMNANLNARFSEINANINARVDDLRSQMNREHDNLSQKHRRPHHESRNPSDPATLIHCLSHSPLSTLHSRTPHSPLFFALACSLDTITKIGYDLVCTEIYISPTVII